MNNLNQITKIQDSKFNKLLSCCLFLIAICWGIYIHKTGHVIRGPFIFGDESTYFDFARSIHLGRSLAQFTQYGPLYPAIISLFFYIQNIFKTYHWIKLLNITLFLSTCVPAYYSAKLLFTNKWLRALLPLCVLFTPFSGLVHLIWAEPCYSALFYWSFFLLILFTKKPTLIKSILLGTFLSSLYYTKPGAGLVIQIAALITLIIINLTDWRKQTKFAVLFSGIIVFTYAILDLPWILHYHHLGLSIIGYSSATKDLAINITENGYLAMALKVFKSAFYQFSYVSIGSWGMFGVGITLLVIRWNSLNNIERNVMLFTIFSALGLIALCALGASSYRDLDPRLPSGRYYTLLLPLITIITLHLLFKIKSEKHYLTKLLLIAIGISTLITIIATPLCVRSPIAFNSLPDLSPIIYISDQGNMIWRPTIERPTPILRYSVALFFGVFALCIVLFRKFRYTPSLVAIIIFTGILFSSWTEQYYICNEGNSYFHDLYRFFYKKHILSSQIVFDKKFENDNIPFLTHFWMDDKSHFISANEVVNKSKQIKQQYFVTSDKFSLDVAFSNGVYTVYKIH